MLKIYRVTNYVSIDGADWREVGYGGYITSSTELENCLVFDNLTFDEVREYLLYCNLHGIHNDVTFFRSKPIIKVHYYDTWEPVEYRHFKKMSLKRNFEEWSDVSLDWIIKNLSADECIQYLKGRGMTACPILK